MWISQKNENKRRAKNHQSAPQIRPQSTKRLDLTFPKTARIRSRGHYQRVHKAGNKFIGDLVIIDYRLGSSFCPKLGITVSRRYGKAHDRNRFKRVVREAFRHSYPLFPVDLEMNVLPRNPQIKITTQAILQDLSQLLLRFQ